MHCFIGKIWLFDRSIRDEWQLTDFIKDRIYFDTVHYYFFLLLSMLRQILNELN